MTRNLTLRFAPVGRKHLKKYRIVAAQKYRSVNKLYLEVVGTYDPVSKSVTIKEDRLKYYLALNVEISESLQSLLKKQNYIKTEKKVYPKQNTDVKSDLKAVESIEEVKPSENNEVDKKEVVEEIEVADSKVEQKEVATEEVKAEETTVEIVEKNEEVKTEDNVEVVEDSSENKTEEKPEN